MRYLAVLLLCLFSFGCGGNGKSIDTNTDTVISGEWIGTWKTIDTGTRMTVGTYNTRIHIEQTNNAIGGVISVNGTEIYPFTGSISGSSITLEITLNDEKTVFSGTIEENSMTLMAETEEYDELITCDRE